VFGIFTSRAMRERGKYQIKLMKTRSSSGVGQKVDLEFNIESLKISDLPEDEQEHSGASRGTSSIIESIKNRNTVQQVQRVDPETGEIDPNKGVGLGKIKSNVQSTKLREILNSMGNDEI